MDKEKQTKIKEIIKEFFSKISPKDIPEEVEIKENVVSFQIKTDDPEILIGKNGQVLIAAQYLLSKIINHQIGEKIFIDLDINQYKKKKIEYLTDLAKSKADIVSLTKKEEVLPPMPPFERRIIHLALKDREDITTQSEGDEPQRKVIIKPASF